MRHNLAKTMITSLIVILLAGIVTLAVVLYSGDFAQSKSSSIDDIVENSYETSELTTDLDDGSFVRIQFQVLTDEKKAKKELEKREFQIKNILIKELTTLEEEDFKTELDSLEETLVSKLNEVMTDGEVTDVYTINKILQ